MQYSGTTTTTATPNLRLGQLDKQFQNCSIQFRCFKMSRSVKDLRELINISRLSFHGEDELYKSDERDGIAEHGDQDLLQSGQNSLLKRDEKLSTCIKPTRSEDASKTSLRNVRFKPLPAINSSKTTTERINNKTVQDTEMSFQKSCNSILEYIDGSAVSTWLHRSNESVQWLSKWASTNEYFVRFAKFWLVEMDVQKQRELVELEVGIILDEIAFSVQDGLKCKMVSQQDVMSFFLLIVWEYPSKICNPQSGKFILNAVVTLASGRKDKYRKLLSNVKFATKDPKHIHWILSVRAFALISIVTALVKFYLTLTGLGSQHTDNGSELRSKSAEDFAFDAVRLGYLDILVYLVEEQDLKISRLKNNGSSLLFCAVTSSQVEIIRYILRVLYVLFFKYNLLF